ncbi:hypothetical protein H2198_006815 [Neophaeococcomyces mojaviensis]|uniref:Uncharacterized protein n=1 Tax=Neophaeococcomyces mojaviensis TaxID=3383035 RepID=A0ACC3A2I0_9EURO|nr:hypothetical protein H2198_006815 [Knufia sp. JES_112]
MHSQAFRLLDLPQEIQDNVYAKYYEGVWLVLQRVEWRSSILFSAKIGFNPLPDLRVEQTCRKVLTDSRRARRKVWPRKLVIDNLLGIKLWLTPLASDLKYDWLRGHVETIEFKAKNTQAVINAGVEELIQECPNLQQVQFTYNVYHTLNGDDQLTQSFASVKDGTKSSREMVVHKERGFEQIARLLLNQRGPNACVKITIIMHYVRTDMGSDWSGPDPFPEAFTFVSIIVADVVMLNVD